MKLSKILSPLMASILCLALASCSGGVTPDARDDPEGDVLSTGVPNIDGEIGGRGDSWAGEGEALRYGYDADACCIDGGAYPYEGIIPEMTMPGVSDGIYPPYGDQWEYKSGTLTAGEWRDNKNWSDWLPKLASVEWTAIAGNWGIPVKNRVAVRVLNQETPVKSADVLLLDDSGKALWRAVTDHEGFAYLFWYESGGGQNYPSAPAAVRASAAGVTTDAAYAGQESVELQLKAENPVKKLDLMFVVDTTGSMSDELEYLKAELEDVVTRAAGASGAQVRSSVNFYRDEGDEYVVRYFGFKDDVAETLANIKAQSANGGGDYPEAVHTALHNAVYDHAWDEGDSVKLMFLLLDAPPHDNAEVKESLIKTVERAAEMGIRIIPVMSSGTDTVCEVLFRGIAALTGGTYVFLTNDSGVGYGHAEQNVGDFSVEQLNDLMVRVISEYCS